MNFRQFSANNIGGKGDLASKVTVVDGESLGVDGTQPPMNPLRELPWGLGWTRKEGILS